MVVLYRPEQTDLTNRLNASQNVVLGTSVTYPYISTEENAQRKANQILTNRSVIQTGTVTTFERFSMSPGDVFRLVIPDKQIDGDFRAAEITHSWRADTADVTVAEQTEGTSDELLASLSDDVGRIDARDADPDGETTQFLELTDGITVDLSSTVTRSNLGTSRFTPGLTRDAPGLSRKPLGFPSGATATPDINSIVITREGLNRFRDAWQGEAPDTVDTLAFGTGTTSATIGDDSLENQVASTTGSAVASGSFEIDLNGTLSSGGAADGQDLTEFGFFDSSGTLLIRATFEPSQHSSEVEHDVTTTITIDNDGLTVRVTCRQIWYSAQAPQTPLRQTPHSERRLHRRKRLRPLTARQGRPTWWHDSPRGTQTQMTLLSWVRKMQAMNCSPESCLNPLVRRVLLPLKQIISSKRGISK